MNRAFTLPYEDITNLSVAHYIRPLFSRSILRRAAAGVHLVTDSYQGPPGEFR